MKALCPKKIEISSTYLLEVAKLVDSINSFYENQGLPPLTASFNKHLETTFQNFAQYQSTYVTSKQMQQYCVLATQTQLEKYCWDSILYLLQRETSDLAKIIKSLCEYSIQHLEDCGKLILAERKEKIDDWNGQKDRQIKQLKEEIIQKKESIKELEQQIKVLNEDNTIVYEHLISNAKLTIDQNLSSSLSMKNNRPRLVEQSSLSRLKQELNNSHKPLTSRQTEEIIMDIMESKINQESIHNKHVSMHQYLEQYFRNKFGMKHLAEQLKVMFRHAVDNFAKINQKNIFILFQKIRQEQCEQSYFYEIKAFYQRAIKFIKRYLSEKEMIPPQTLGKLLDSKVYNERNDIILSPKQIEFILGKVYSKAETETLQLIFSETLKNKLDKQDVLCKQLMNQILNYELSKHIEDIHDVVKAVKEADQYSKGYLIPTEVEDAHITVCNNRGRLEFLGINVESKDDKVYTYSQAIEILLRTQKSRYKGRGKK